jgi:hypothetical protein
MKPSLGVCVSPGGEVWSWPPPLEEEVVVRFCDVFLLAMPLELVSSVRSVSSVRFADSRSSADDGSGVNVTILQISFAKQNGKHSAFYAQNTILCKI